MLQASDFLIRDPFILVSQAEQCYYLYGSQSFDQNCFLCYRSCDLVHWEQPTVVFRAGNGFWASEEFWAPEVHFYRGKYYMFATFHSEKRCRGTQILVADRPDGAFVPLTEFPVTPSTWECLDGTLWVDQEEQPWMIFCHEWLQIQDGAICAMPLTADLTAAAGVVTTLFHASDAAWVVPLKNHDNCYVTDGPFLYRENGELCMLWSSFGRDGYAMGKAVARAGNILGGWQQCDTLIFAADGGHGMRFTALDGQCYHTMHRPNTHKQEHLSLLKVK